MLRFSLYDFVKLRGIYSLFPDENGEQVLLSPAPRSEGSLYEYLIEWFFRTFCGSGRPKHTQTEQVKVSAPIHLALNELEAINLAFGLAITPSGV